MTTFAPKLLSRRALMLAAGSACALPTWSQVGGVRPLNIVVPFAPGGSTDGTARRMAERMATHLGTPVVVDNKPGAGSFTAIQSVLGAPRDGRSLFMSGTASMSLMPLVYSKLPFKFDDLVPLTTISRQPFVLNASMAVPTGSLEQFLAWARAKPEGVTFGTTGIGTIGHILAEWVGQSLGIKFNTVPYRGTSQGALDLMAGRIDLQVDGMSTALIGHLGGKTQLLASLGRAGERGNLPASVRTMADMGYPDLVAHVEFGLWYPRGTPEDAVKRLFDAVVVATQNPEFAKALAAAGETAAPSASPAEYAARLDSERARWAPIAKRLNIDLS